MSEEQTSNDLDRGASGVSNAAGSLAKTAYNTAQSAVSAGSSAAAATQTGAAAGTAAGPAGTAIGAVVGAAVGLFGKPLVKGAIVVIVVLVMVFKSLPSMFWENPKDVFDNTAPTEVYAQFKAHADEMYIGELEKQKDAINLKGAVLKTLYEDEYDNVIFTYSFNPSEEVFLAQLQDSSNLIIAMFELKQDDWRKADFKTFKSMVNSVNFWNDTVTTTFQEETKEVKNEDGERNLYIHHTYLISDVSIGGFRQKFNTTGDSDYLQAIEMAYNIKLYFGEEDGMPIGGIIGTTNGGADATYPGGGTHTMIRSALANLENPRPFFGGTAIAPLDNYHYTSSEFGPRNFAPDPLHTGLDFSANEGEPIKSIMDGEVLFVFHSKTGFGNHIVVYHGGAVTTMYAHMISFGSFKVGDEVRAGDIVGYVGTTGLSTGNHLHLEYQENGYAKNPRHYLPAV